MKIALLCASSFCIGAFCIALFFSYQKQTPVGSFLVQPTPLPTPLVSYSFENLSTHQFQATGIELGDVISETKTSRSQLFHFSFAPSPTDTTLKKVTGVVNTPKADGTYPVLVMLRGYAPLSSYRSGVGTQPSASVFVENGYITIAPDFLGYGGSDMRTDDPYEARFQSYTTVLSLLASLENMNSGLDASYSGKIRADTSRTGLWGHSNGGHIALATLAITKAAYPTVLWAPVSKPFPYSILAYSDEDADGGKAERKDLARFESFYDVELFNPAKYYDRIAAPLQIHQGMNDPEVPFWWSDELATFLRKEKKAVEYERYPGADHNLRPAWNEAVNKSVDFYADKLAK